MVVSADQYCDAALRTAIGQIALSIGWHSMGDQSFELLQQLAGEYIKAIGKVSSRYAVQAGRTHAAGPDINRAFEQIGVSWSELHDYVQAVEPMPFAGRIKKFPSRRRGVSRLIHAQPLASTTVTKSELSPEQVPPEPYRNGTAALATEEPSSSDKIVEEEQVEKPPIEPPTGNPEHDRVKQRLNELLALQEDEDQDQEQHKMEHDQNAQDQLMSKPEEQDEEEDETIFNPEDYYEGWLPPLITAPADAEAQQKAAAEAAAKAEQSAMEKITDDKGRHLKVSELEACVFHAIVMSSSGQPLFKSEGRGPDPRLPSDSEPESEEEPPIPLKLTSGSETTKAPIKVTLKPKDIKGKRGGGQVGRPRKGKENDKKEKKTKPLMIKVTGLNSGTPTASPKIRSGPSDSELHSSSLSKADELALDASIDAVIARVTSEPDTGKTKKEKRRKKEAKSKQIVDSPPSSPEPKDRSGSIVDDTINDVISSAISTHSPGRTLSPLRQKPLPKGRSPKGAKRLRSDSESDVDQVSAAQILVSMSEGVDGSGSRDRSPSFAGGLGRISSPTSSGLGIHAGSSPGQFSTLPPFARQSPGRPVIGAAPFSPFQTGSPVGAPNLFSPSAMTGSPHGPPHSTPAPKPFKTLAEKKAMPPLPATVDSPISLSGKDKEEKKAKKRKKDKKDKDKDKDKDKERHERDRDKDHDKDKAAKKKRKEEKKKERESAAAGDQDIPRLSIKFNKDQEKDRSTIDKKDKIRSEKDKKVLKDKPEKKSMSPAAGGSDRKSCILITQTITETTDSPKKDKSGKSPIQKTKAKEPTPVSSKKSKKDQPPLDTVDVPVVEEDDKVWICPSCSKPDDGSPMIGCDVCDDWYHWTCLGIKTAPKEDTWFCKRCIAKQKLIETHAHQPRRGGSTSSPPDRPKTGPKSGKAPKPAPLPLESEPEEESSSDDGDDEDYGHQNRKPSKAQLKKQLYGKPKEKKSEKRSSGEMKMTHGQEEWICPRCNKPDDGRPMIGCEVCDDWFHWECVGVHHPPKKEDPWFCLRCSAKKRKEQQQKSSSGSKEPSKGSTTGGKSDERGTAKNWSCSQCRLNIPGKSMVGCDGCDKWYHWTCVNLVEEPEENECWFCKHCIAKQAAIASKLQK